MLFFRVLRNIPFFHLLRKIVDTLEWQISECSNFSESGKAAQGNHQAWWLCFGCTLCWPKWITLIWRSSPHLYFMMAERSNFIGCYMIHNHGEALRPPLQLLFILDEKMVLIGVSKDYIHPQTLSRCDIRWWNRWCLLLSPMKLWIFHFRMVVAANL